MVLHWHPSSESLYLLPWEPRPGPSTSDVASPVLSKGEASSPLTCCWCPASCSLEYCWSFLLPEHLAGSYSICPPTRIHRSLLLSQSSSCLYWCPYIIDISVPRCKTLHFLCLRFLSVHFSSLLKFLWMVEPPPQTPTPFLSSVNKIGYILSHSSDH